MITGAEQGWEMNVLDNGVIANRHSSNALLSTLSIPRISINFWGSGEQGVHGCVHISGMADIYLF